MKLLIFGVSSLVLVVLVYQYGRSFWYPVIQMMNEKQTVEEVIERYSMSVPVALAPLFRGVGIEYPPKKLTLMAFKDTKQLEVWAANREGDIYQKVTTYPILAASGKLGPKLQEGDRQVPEGIYKLIGFNPNSAFHLSMKLNYPNAFDLKHAEAEGRYEPGSNIFIHGRESSVGCLAMGDPVIEKLFTLVHATGLSHTDVLIFPTTPPINGLVVPQDVPAWTSQLYAQLQEHYERVTQGYFER